MIVHLFTYADESGIEADQRYCIVAGYVGAPAEWDGLRDEWARLVKKHRLTELKGKRYFRRHNRQHHYIDEFLKLIEKYDIKPRGFAVEWNAFMALSPVDQAFLSGAPLPPLKEAIPYITTALFFGDVANDVGPLGADRVRVHFIFDDQHKFKGHLIDSYYQGRDLLIASGEHRAGVLGILTFDNSRCVPEIQAADLLCYTLLKVLQDGASCRQDIADAYERARKDTEIVVWREPGLRSALSKRRELHYGDGDK